MAGLFDFLQGVMGRPDPMQQVYAGLGQAPGQPGSPAGQQPGAAAPAAPPGGDGPPGGAGGPPGGPQGPQAPPQPQVYQSPPDLAQMYLALSQRDQARQQFNSGLGLLAASMYPGRHPEMIMKAMSGGGEDAGSTFQNLAQINQWQQQNQALQAFQRSLPDIATQSGLTQDQVRALGPQGAADLMAKIAESRTGVTGNPAQKELYDARKAWHDANQGKTDAEMIAARPELGSLAEFVPAMAEKSKLATDRGADIAEAQSKFGDLQGTSEDFLGKLGQLSTDQNLGKITGMGVDPQTISALPISAQKKYYGGEEGYALKQLVDNLQGQAYAANFGHGQGRLSTQEASKLLEGRSQLNKLGMDTETYRQQAISPLIVQTMRVMANNYGASGKLDSMPGYLKPYLSSIYTKGGQYYTESGSHVVAPQKGATPMTDADMSEAQKQIALYGPQTVLKHLRDNGYDTSQLE